MQVEYYAQGHQVMQELNRELDRLVCASYDVLLHVL